MKRIGFFLCLTAFGLSFYLFELHRFFNLAALQEHLTLLQAWQSDRPWLLRGSFFVIYVLLAGLSLPGATMMTLAAGALFGLLWGTLLASFASSLGALFAFLSSRYLLRDWIRDILSAKRNALMQAYKKTAPGIFYPTHDPPGSLSFGQLGPESNLICRHEPLIG